MCCPTYGTHVKNATPRLHSPIWSIKATNTRYSAQQLRIEGYFRAQSKERTENNPLPKVSYHYRNSCNCLAKNKNGGCACLPFNSWQFCFLPAPNKRRYVTQPVQKRRKTVYEHEWRDKNRICDLIYSENALGQRTHANVSECWVCPRAGDLTLDKKSI